MSKLFYLTTALSITFSLLTNEATLSSKYSVEPNSNVEGLVCYMQTEDGKTLNLSRFCGNRGRSTTTTPVLVKQFLETKQCQRCNLNGTNLSGSNLVGADLRNADLRNADLRNANMFGANLKNASMNNAQLSGATMPDGTIHK
jgi:uncharacterized protein YjbI with pentapeptide repeats